MNSRANKVFLAVTFLLDILVVDISLWLAYFIRFPSHIISYQVFQTWDLYLSVAIIEALLFPLVFALQGLYAIKRGASRIDELYRILTAVSIGTVVTMAITSFTLRDFDYSRGMLLLAWLAGIFLVWFCRLVEYWVHGVLRSRGVAEDRVLLVGVSPIGKIIADKIGQSPRLGYKLVGYVSGKSDSGDLHFTGLPALGKIDEVGDVVHQHKVTEIIVVDSSLSHQDIIDIVARCEKERVNIKLFPDVFQIMASAVSIGDLDGLPMVSIRDVALRGWNLAIKRAMDTLLSAATLILVSPFMLLMAMLIKLTSPSGPVFYLQVRVGLDGKPFKMVKFRSMKPNAEVRTGPVWATENDPRRTRLGTFLRRTSIDELPQFINVLLGEMSIVGPRPERPVFVEQFSQQVPRYFERHKERAGITGWAQVNGLRGNTSVEERTAYDIWYVEHWTLLLDIKIILRTVISVIRDKHAY